MILINSSFLKNFKCIDVNETFIDSNYLKFYISRKFGIPSECFLAYYNGHQLSSKQGIPNGSTIHLVLTLPGGKGGFGSMLRAIGAQIEKTTNREACRDLSGRRLRDINEEQRLKRWISKKAEREAELEKRQKDRLEKLKLKPKHEFQDTEYDKKRSELPERIDKALTEGLQKAPQVLPKKRPIGEGSDQGPSTKKACLWLGVEGFSSSESDTEQDVQLLNEANQNQIIPSECGEQLCCSIDDTPCEPTKDSDLIDLLSNKNTDIGEPENLTNNFKEANRNEDLDNSLLVPSSEETAKVKNEEKFVIDLLSFNDPKELELLGLEKLKSALTCLGLKCGGTITERVERLWKVRGLERKNYPSSLQTKTKKQKTVPD